MAKISFDNQSHLDQMLLNLMLVTIQKIFENMVFFNMHLIHSIKIQILVLL